MSHYEDDQPATLDTQDASEALGIPARNLTERDNDNAN